MFKLFYKLINLLTTSYSTPINKCYRNNCSCHIIMIVEAE